jgi:hypothetical protein
LDQREIDDVDSVFAGVDDVSLTMRLGQGDELRVLDQVRRAARHPQSERPERLAPHGLSDPIYLHEECPWRSECSVSRISVYRSFGRRSFESQAASNGDTWF